FSVTAGYNTTPSAGYGSVGGGQTGASAAGISGIAGNTAVRTGDPSGGVQPGPSASAIMDDIAAQISITQAATSVLINLADRIRSIDSDRSIDGGNAVAGTYSRGSDQFESPADQANYLREMSSMVANYADQMRDICSDCSSQGFVSMSFVISPGSARDAGLPENTMATYDAQTNTATVYQDFFRQSPTVQASTLFHEYIHSLQENRDMVANATQFQWGLSHSQRPWEIMAIQLEREFQLRFGQQIWGRFR
ncbi:hypothetical protein, partial [Xenophilus sp.]|uniref:hypothetical protein n=1 Tax=Xenophilus sp. TaxID=1873499 RepID=UPI0037DD3423